MYNKKDNVNSFYDWISRLNLYISVGVAYLEKQNKFSVKLNPFPNHKF